MSVRFRWLGIAVAVLIAALAMLAVNGGSMAATHGSPSSKPLGGRLVNRFFGDLKRHDVADLRRFLAPVFQSERTDGTRETKSQYLHMLPNVLSYRLRALRTTANGKVAVVTYEAKTREVIHGKEYSLSYTPRMTVFVVSGHRWRVVAHGNFNTPG